MAIEQDAFRENLAKWSAAAIEDYEFDYRRNCFCGGPGVRPVHIEIRGGEVVAVVPNVTMGPVWAHRVDFVLVVEKTAVSEP